jgi:eukaryotic-like serine/threonine-protein kinase
MPLGPGTKLGPYEVLAPLGAGGMGEVYRARDERLKRDVALKVLPAAYTDDPERVRRFEQEAQAASALNHPNILAVHDFGAQDGTTYIVAELLEGETLRSRLAGGALPLRRVLAYAQQIVSGLAAAHEKGIVHRDLKPENVFITSDGRVKLLDFGLAKLTHGKGGSGETNLETQTRDTGPGVMLGTVGYMSPEQVRGKPAEPRSDIFAFGAILYEMLSGQRAFRGDTAADTLSAILTREPPELSEPGGRVPESLGRIVRHCLEKNPEARFHSASDIAFDLEALSGSSGDSRAVARAPLRWRAAPPAAIAAIAALALGFWWGGQVVRSTSPPGKAVRSVILLPEGVILANMAISPDGTQLAVSGIDREGKRRLWVRSLDASEFRPLPVPEGSDLPFWSPDGRFLAFFVAGTLRKIDVSAGPPTVLADASVIGGTWGPGGEILFSGARGAILKVSASGGKPTPVTKLDPARHETSHRYPQFLPDGRHFLYLAVNLAGNPEDEANQVHVASLDSNDDRIVMRGYSRTLYALGHLLYMRAATFAGPLMAQPFDPTRLETHGEPVTVAESVSVFGDYYLFASFDVSANGTLVYDGEQVVSRLAWFDRAGRPLGTFGEPAVVQAPRISPDGTRVAYAEFDASLNKMQIWIGDLSRGVRTRLTSGPSENSRPIWSPDGSRIAFQTDRKHQGDIYLKSSQAGGTEAPLYEAASLSYPEDWSRDGGLLSLFHYSEDRTPTLGVLRPSGEDRPTDLVQSDFNALGQSRFSPDGRWLAYINGETQRPEVYVTSLPVRDTTLQISSAGGVLPSWRRDGRELFYATPDGMMMSVDIVPGPKLSAGTPKPLFRATAPKTMGAFALYDVTPDGQRFLVVEPVVHGSSAPVNLVLNWTAGLTKAK